MEASPKAKMPAKNRDGVIGPSGDKGTKGTQSYSTEGAPAQPQSDEPPPFGGDGQTKGSQSYPVQGK